MDQTNNNIIYSKIQSVKKNPVYAYIFIITIAGMILRVHGLGSVPFWVDEISSVFAAEQLAQTGSAKLPSGYEYTRSPLSHRIMAISIMLFGTNEFIARLPIALVGTAVIPLTYYLTKHSIDNRTAVLATTIVGIFEFQVVWARQARMYALFQFLFLLTLTAYILCLRNGSPKRGGLLVIPVVLMSITHSMWIVVLPVLVISILIDWRSTDQNVNYVRYSSIGAISMILFSIIVFETPVFPPWVYGLVTTPVDTVSYWSAPIDHLSGEFFGLYVLSIIGTAGLLLSRQRKSVIIPVAFWLPIFAITYYSESFRVLSWYPRYIYFVIPLFLILACYGATVVVRSLYLLYLSLADAFVKGTKEASISPVQLFIVAVILLSIVSLPHITHVNPEDRSTLVEPQPDYRSAVEEIKTDHHSSHVVIANRPQMVLFYLNDVDFMGDKNENTKGIIDGQSGDYYTGVPLIENKSEMESTISENDCGWVIHNTFRGVEAKEQVQELEHYKTIRPTWNHTEEEVVYIYRWGGSDCWKEDDNTR